jgi:hypothetical protein
MHIEAYPALLNKQHVCKVRNKFLFIFSSSADQVNDKRYHKEHQNDPPGHACFKDSGYRAAGGNNESKYAEQDKKKFVCFHGNFVL